MVGFFMSPVTKFGYNCISYAILLSLFTWFVLTDLRPATEPNSPSTIEYVVIFWVGTLMAEELRQVEDLFYFVLILAVFVVSFGVVIEAILYPNMDPDIRIIFKSLYKPYWQLYGELFLEEVEGLIDYETCHEDPRFLNQCPSVEGHRWVAPVLTAIYMLISSILLINLLIAVFSYTIDSVQKQSKTVWRFIRYGIVNEYVDRPTLAPPLIIVNHIFRVLLHICKDLDSPDKYSCYNLFRNNAIKDNDK
ncbi:transient receptor potential cation channel subfamily M member 5-like [Saccoglossus kowalevskii]